MKSPWEPGSVFPIRGWPPNSADVAKARLLYIVGVDRIKFAGENVRRRGVVFVDPRMSAARILDNGAIVLRETE